MGVVKLPEEKNISEMVKEMYEDYKIKGDAPENKPKEWKLPFSKRFGAPAKVKKNNILTLVITTNKQAKMIWLPIDDNAIYIPRQKDTPHSVTTKNIMQFGKYPLAIVHEDITEAYNPEEQIEQADKENKLAIGEKVIINEAKKAALALQQKKGLPMNIILIVIGLVVAAIIGYNLFKGNLF